MPRETRDNFPLPPLEPLGWRSDLKGKASCNTKQLALTQPLLAKIPAVQQWLKLEELTKTACGEEKYHGHCCGDTSK